MPDLHQDMAPSSCLNPLLPRLIPIPMAPGNGNRLVIAIKPKWMFIADSFLGTVIKRFSDWVAGKLQG